MSQTPPVIPAGQPSATTSPLIPVPTQDDRTMGMLSHLVAILSGIIGAVIMFVCLNKRSMFIQHHTKESLNFQITILIIEVAGIILTAVLGLVTMGFALLILIPALGIIVLLALVLEIIACIAANKGELHRYPWSIRFVK